VREARAAGIAASLVAGVVYVVTACPYVLGGDVGELAAIGLRGGTAHPPGYPAYMLWLRLWSWLPATSPAHRAALATAALGALAVWMLHRACRAWGASAASATIVSLVFAFGPLAWDLATHAEVFSLNVVIACAIVTLAAPATDLTDDRRVLLLGFAAGLGLANHHSIVLLAPLGLWAAVCSARRSAKPLRAVLLGVGGLAIGLLPYAHLAWRARTAGPQDLVWGDPTTLSGLVRIFLRSDYGTTHLAISTAAREPLGQERLLAGSVLAGLLGLPIVALGGAALAWKKRTRVVPLAMLAASALLAGPVFVAIFNLAPRGLSAHIVERFHLLPTALVAVLTAIGLDPVLARIRHPQRDRIAYAIAAILGLVRGAVTRPELAERQRGTTERWLDNVLATLPPNAVVVGDGDDAVSGFLYEQVALGKRPDVVHIAPRLLFAKWYTHHVALALGDPGFLNGGPVGELSEPAMLRELLALGRPVYVLDTSNLGTMPTYPVGPVIRVVADAKDILDPYALEKENLGVFGKLALDAEPPLAGTWAGLRWPDYARPWRSLAASFERLGDKRRADICRKRALRFDLRVE
jgi:hypothetical protein